VGYAGAGLLDQEKKRGREERRERSPSYQWYRNSVSYHAILLCIELFLQRDIASASLSSPLSQPIAINEKMVKNRIL
jgi:hypothetical protein